MSPRRRLFLVVLAVLALGGFGLHGTAGALTQQEVEAVFAEERRAADQFAADIRMSQGSPAAISSAGSRFATRLQSVASRARALRPRDDRDAQFLAAVQTLLRADESAAARLGRGELTLDGFTRARRWNGEAFDATVAALTVGPGGGATIDQASERDQTGGADVVDLVIIAVGVIGGGAFVLAFIGGLIDRWSQDREAERRRKEHREWAEDIRRVEGKYPWE
jgi:hypothetical protein